MTDYWAELPKLRDVIAASGLRAEKKLGQNFLLDRNLVDRIVRSAGDLSGVTVFEIGPGPGGLTRSILNAGAERVIAVEYDPRAVAALAPLAALAAGRLEIRQQDALDADLPGLSPAGYSRQIIANLPYNIATPLLTRWLRGLYEDPNAFAGMTLMFQKEVAERIAAAPGNKAYGRLAVLAQWLCRVEPVMDVPPQAFVPPPKVTSAVLRFTPLERQGPQPAFAAVERVTAAAFGQRRKMIRSSLKNWLPRIEALGLDPTLRAEDLKVADFLKLARSD